MSNLGQESAMSNPAQEIAMTDSEKEASDKASTKLNLEGSTISNPEQGSKITNPECDSPILNRNQELTMKKPGSGCKRSDNESTNSKLESERERSGVESMMSELTIDSVEPDDHTEDNLSANSPNENTSIQDDNLKETGDTVENDVLRYPFAPMKSSDTEVSTADIVSREEAILFMTNKLEIIDIELKLSSDKVGLLNELVDKWLQRIPFQDVTQISRDPMDRAIKGIKESVEDILSGCGGMCWSHNVTLYYVIKALGFEAYMAISAVIDKTALNHVLVIAENVLDKGDSYLLDVGTGYPSFTAVPLDFDTCSPIYKESFLTFKYVRNVEENLVMRMHLTKNGVDSTGRPFPNCDKDGWALYFYVWLKECSVQFIQNQLDYFVYRDLSFRFNNFIRAIKFPNHRLIAMKDNTLLEENENGKLDATEFGSSKEVQMALMKHFPEIPENVITSCVKNARGLPA